MAPQRLIFSLVHSSSKALLVAAETGNCPSYPSSSAAQVCATEPAARTDAMVLRSKKRDDTKAVAAPCRPLVANSNASRVNERAASSRHRASAIGKVAP